MKEGYRRVTSILYPFSGLDKLDQTIVNNAAKRGTKVHKIIEGIVQGLGEFAVDDEVKGYIESFKKWWGEGKEVLYIERRFYCDLKKITGQVDLIINTPEGIALVDYKTSFKPSKTWPVQGSGYYYLAKEAGIDVKKVFFLHLNKYGKKPKVYSYKPDSSFFLITLMVYEHFYGE